MALAVDSTGTSFTGTTGSFSAAFVNTAGGLVVAFVTIGNGSAVSAVAVTYGGVSLANFNNVTWQTAFDYCGLFWSATSMPTGSNTLAVTFSGTAGGSTGCTACGMSFTGYDTGTPILHGNTNSGSGTSATCVQTSTVSGNILVGIAGGGSAFSNTAETTLIYRNNFSLLSAGGCGQASRTAGTGGTVTFTETLGSDSWGLCVMEIAAASGGGARGLFRTPAMTGLGGGGSFFRDPLAATMQMVRRDRIFVPAWMGEAA